MKEKTRKGVEDSAVFLIVGTENYFGEPPMDEINYAKALKKPFRVLLWEGVTPFEGFRDGVEDYIEVICNDNNLEEKTGELFQSDLKKRRESHGE